MDPPPDGIEELKQPKHVLVPHEDCQTNSNSFGPNSFPIWPERNWTFVGKPAVAGGCIRQRRGRGWRSFRLLLREDRRRGRESDHKRVCCIIGCAGTEHVEEARPNPWTF